jgi:pimeloyl-ACP methyl ester carboxylesterase
MDGTGPHHVLSADGTEIGYWTSGVGPPLLLVHGALGDHSRWDVLRPHLESRFQIHAMDRRGRGASGDGPTYAIERETEDIVAVVDAIAASRGTTVEVYCSSYGGLCAFGAPASTSNIGRLALYEAWPPVDTEPHESPPGFVEQMNQLIANDEREAALELAYRELLQLADDELAEVKSQDSWSARVAAAHTIPREVAAFPEFGFDPALAATIDVPTLLLIGSESPAWGPEAETVAAAIPDARITVLDGQGHVADLLAPELVADALVSFLIH